MPITYSSKIVKLEPAKFHAHNKLSKYERIRVFLEERQLPAYRFSQITQAIFKERIGDFAQMHTLPESLRSALRATFGENILSLRAVHESLSPQARKLLFELEDHKRIEAVGMTYRAGWQSFCISSQSGCNFGCTFCATGAIGLKRSLTADEITDQILYFHLQKHSIDSVSFMGMGEALANPHTFRALQILIDPALFGLSPRRLTVSTIGVIPSIQRLTREFPQVNLTFSLHSPFTEQRSLLVPLNRTYPLHEVMLALDEHVQQTGRKVYLAYTLLHGVNDTPEHARGLIALLKERGNLAHLYHINLISYNPASGAPVTYERSDKQTFDSFYRRLKAAGMHVTARQSFGVEIDAACGQLYGRYQAAHREQPPARASTLPGRISVCTAKGPGL
ncbi:23S rRNA (adenine(2503)-C(8))-methyltransferase Cfr [Ktedonosporobacter rubrisoli]|uniref:23S rRNA (Adenine(2503)-C(8))-methyltransferase Cfr n=1 Tax=Ktedonosporobacter rubrisoli TaxID=2509675 RepID=A0A4P6JKC3_KTERU|nr:23S rRNA (adenine(2503)-C(8))-methyltransferase Cfr [Ktedonosporobacter rubrisoli]QBD75503.1 23S rRNA (adenine(2503)-C(8))-methyltransferase Cfr [Ktedonosporobacter rubrisoli]